MRGVRYTSIIHSLDALSRKRGTRTKKRAGNLININDMERFGACYREMFLVENYVALFV